MSRIADVLHKRRQQERDRAARPADAEVRYERQPPTMDSVTIPWQLDAPPAAPAAPVVPAAPPVQPVPVAPLAAVPPAAPPSAPPSAPPLASGGPPWPGPPELADLVQHLFFAGGSKGTPVRRVLFTGADASNLVREVARSVSEALAHLTTGAVCLADLDLRRPSLALHYRLEGKPGFSDLVLDESSTAPAVHPVRAVPRLSVMSAGTRTADVRTRLAEPETLARLTTALSPFDYVVALTATLATQRDAIILGGAFDGIVLVAEAGATDPEAVRGGAETLQAAGIRLLGTFITSRADGRAR